jgi:hypothetical protein
LGIFSVILIVHFIDRFYMQLEAQISTVNAFFSLPLNSSFRIPYYQRRYEWVESNVIDLLQDISDHIVDNAGPNPQQINLANCVDLGGHGINRYLLGGVFLYKEQSANGDLIWHIIDGQQRTTTITLVAVALAKALMNEINAALECGAIDLMSHGHYVQCFHAPLSSLYMRPLNPFANELIRPKIAVNHSIDEYIDLLNGSDVQCGAENKVCRRYVSNYSTAVDFFNKLLDGDLSPITRIERLCLFAGTLRLHTGLVVTVAATPVGAAPQHTDVVNLFSKINARGRDLSHSDMLKVYLLSNLPHQHALNCAEEWDEKFEEMETKDIDLHLNLVYSSRNNAFPKVMTTAWNTYLNGINNDERVSLLRDVIFKLAPKSEYWLAMLASADPRIKAYSRCIDLLKKLPFSEWAAVLYRLESNGGPIDSKIRTIKLLQAVCFCFAICGTYDNRRKALLRDIFLNPVVNWSDIYSDMVEVTINRLREANLYSEYSLDKRRFIMQFIDLRLIGDIGADYDHQISHIEHVLPQNNQYWINQNGWTNVCVVEWLHKIGNLAFLPFVVNAAVSNLPYAQKIAAINNNPLNVFAYGLNIGCANNNQIPPQWTPAIVERRHNFILARVDAYLNGLQLNVA